MQNSCSLCQITVTASCNFADFYVTHIAGLKGDLLLRSKWRMIIRDAAHLKPRSEGSRQLKNGRPGTSKEDIAPSYFFLLIYYCIWVTPVCLHILCVNLWAFVLQLLFQLTPFTAVNFPLLTTQRNRVVFSYHAWYCACTVLFLFILYEFKWHRLFVDCCTEEVEMQVVYKIRCGLNGYPGFWAV